MMDTTTDLREQVSALMDGELRGEAFAQAVGRVAGDAQACADWNAFHLVGEVLRTGHHAAQGADMAFVERLRAQLQDVVVAPGEPAAEVVAVLPVREAANGPAWRWKLVAGFASMAAVLAVGWNMAGFFQGTAPGAQLAQGPGVPAVSVARSEPMGQPTQMAGGEPRQVMIRDARLDELVAAHKAGNASALQMPSGFLRNATFEGPAR